MEVSTDSLRAWTTIWNSGTPITSQSRVVFDAANGFRYLTIIAPDNSYSVAIARYGTNVSQTSFDSAGSQLGQTTYAYDAHGRPCKFTDARTGTTTNYFDNADQLNGMVTPIPVAYNYDAKSRMKTMKTWKDFSNPATAATTTWNYDIYRGWPW